MKMNGIFVAVLVLGCASALPAQQSAEEQAVWKLEHSYWEDVKALDLKAYRDLWHADFIGWPSISAQPVRKDHIADWITASSAKGLRLQSYSLEPAASQVTDNIVVVHYWITSAWVDKDGKGDPQTLRITHTWLKTAKDWQIISGMSSPEKELRK